MDLQPLSREDLNKLSPEESRKNRTYLYLRIVDFSCPPDAISEKLKLPPTDKKLKGEEYFISIGKNKNKVKSTSDLNLWEYERKIISDDFIGDLIETFIIDVIEPRITEIKELEDPKRVIFNITYYYYTSNNPGVFIGSKHMKALADINAELDIDIYSLHED